MAAVNRTPIQGSEIARIGYRQGQEWVETIIRSIESGGIDPNRPMTLILPIGNIKVENFSAWTRFLMELGTPRAAMLGNSAIVGLGVYTGGSSAIHYGITNDRKAKFLYGCSALFSASAVSTGGLAVAARSCYISRPAAISEAMGVAFLHLGHKAHQMALQLEGKSIPQRSRVFNRPFTDRSGVAFVDPGTFPSLSCSQVIEVIPFQTIGQLVGVCLTVYGYVRIVMVINRYGQQFLSKYRTARRLEKSKIFLKKVRYVVICCLVIHSSPCGKLIKNKSVKNKSEAKLFCSTPLKNLMAY